MTNRFNNWERLIKVIERYAKSVNAFAMGLGLNRSENLYHIRRGTYGISRDLANRISEKYPDIDKVWLLAGVGDMLLSEHTPGNKIPFYKKEIETDIVNLKNLQPADYAYLPYANASELVMRSMSPAMNEPSTSATDLFLQPVAVKDIVQGNEYVLDLGDRTIWRKVRLATRHHDMWRVVARNREEYPDELIAMSDVKQAWRVIARLSILES